MDSGFSLALSIIIGSIFLVTIMTAQSNLQELKTENFIENIVEEKLQNTKEILKWHVEKIGFNVVPGDLPPGNEIVFTTFDSTLKFYSDIDANGIVDIVELYLGGVEELSSTPNPFDRNLYRKINNGTSEILSIGITYLKFVKTRENSSMINKIEISMLMQLPFPSQYRNEDKYYQSEWLEEICPDNLGWY